MVYAFPSPTAAQRTRTFRQDPTSLPSQNSVAQRRYRPNSTPHCAPYIDLMQLQVGESRSHFKRGVRTRPILVDSLTASHFDHRSSRLTTGICLLEQF